MMVWFCRDDDGEASVWHQDEEPLHKTDGEWTGGWAITGWTNETFAMFGPGFHGVRPGRKKLIELEPVETQHKQRGQAE